jgi:3-oxoadipate enol-lactonase
MPFYETQERIYYADTGSGPAIVFSHGFILDHSIWDAQVAALSSEFRCLAYDVRGHGMSTADRPFTYGEVADDVVRLLDLLEVSEAVLVGHSQGGWISMCAALQHPDRVRGLVLVDTAADHDAPEVSAVYDEWADRWCNDGPIGELAETMLEVQFGADADAWRERWFGKWQSRPPSGYRTIWTSVSEGRPDVLARLQEITAPAVVVHGTADVSFGLDRARAIADGVAHSAGIVEVEGGPHSCSVTHPAAVTTAIDTFMKGL